MTKVGASDSTDIQSKAIKKVEVHLHKVGASIPRRERLIAKMMEQSAGLLRTSAVKANYMIYLIRLLGESL
jgi:hypothetical protein